MATDQTPSATPPGQAAVPRPRTPADDPPPGTGRLSRLPSLTGLRFPAALLVFLFHVSLPYPELRLLESDTAEHVLARTAAQAGGLGVTFFFVLSGFVLTWSARPGDTAGSFWRRRYVKIVPNYVVAWVLALALTVYAAALPPAHHLLGSGLMLQSWIPDYDTNFSVNPPGWSLSTEAFFYLCFPLLLLWANRIDPARLKFWIAGVVAAVAATPLVTYAFIPAGNVFMGNEPDVSGRHLWFAYVFPPPRLLDFLLGILVARAVLLGRWRNIGVAWSMALLGVAYVAASFVPYLYGQRLVLLVPAAFLIAAGALADQDGRRTLFRSRPMVWLGEISFAFYLLHHIVIRAVRLALGEELYSVPVTVAVVAVELGLAVLASWALYEWVEKPLVRRWSRPRGPVRAAVAASPSAPGSPGAYAGSAAEPADGSRPGAVRE